MPPSLRKFSASEAAQERLKIIQLYDKPGEAECIKYFQVNPRPSTSGRRNWLVRVTGLESLVPQSTRPKHVRRMTTDPRIMSFLRERREKQPGLGKEKIKPLLDEHGQTLGIPSLSVSTIGKVLLRHHLFFPKKGRVYHDPGSKQAQKSRKPKRPTDAGALCPPPPQEFGHWQIDTLVRTLDGLRVYFYSAIDIKGKIAFSLPYSRLSSRNAKDFFEKLRAIYPPGDSRRANGQRE